MSLADPTGRPAPVVYSRYHAEVGPVGGNKKTIVILFTAFVTNKYLKKYILYSSSCSV